MWEQLEQLGGRTGARVALAQEAVLWVSEKVQLPVGGGIFDVKEGRSRAKVREGKGEGGEKGTKR